MRVGILLGVLALGGCGIATGPVAVDGSEAPEACGFPDGAALSYAGRSTTAALGVQEVVGDPMSDDPADIYITRERFDQGELNGRLVCAVFVDQPDFVEVTVHPADGGRQLADPEPPPEAPALGPDEVEIVTHCGLGFARVEFEGKIWRFDMENPDPNPPRGWGNPTEVITVKEGPDGPIAIGPDGSEWHLVPVGDDEPEVCL
jgi:hypothetical protein